MSLFLLRQLALGLAHLRRRFRDWRRLDALLGRGFRVNIEALAVQVVNELAVFLANPNLWIGKLSTQLRRRTWKNEVLGVDGAVFLNLTTSFLCQFVPHVQLSLDAFLAFFVRLIVIALSLQPLVDHPIRHLAILALTPRHGIAVFVHACRAGHTNLGRDFRNGYFHVNSAPAMHLA